MEMDKLFLKIKEGFSIKSPYAWYSSRLGQLEPTAKSGGAHQSVIERNFNSGEFCNKDGFILEALSLFGWATAGMVRDGMDLLRRSGERLELMTTGFIESRLNAFIGLGIVAKYQYGCVELEGKAKGSVVQREAWVITSMGLKVLVKHREKVINDYDVMLAMENATKKMTNLSSSYGANIYIKKLGNELVPRISSHRLLRCPGLKGVYYSSKVSVRTFDDNLRVLFFETAFIRDDGYILPEQRISSMVRQYRDILTYIKYKKESYEGDYDARLVILVEDKAALDEVVNILSDKLPEIFDYAWFTSIPIMRIKEVDLPFIHIPSEFIVREDGKTSYKIVLAADEEFY